MRISYIAKKGLFFIHVLSNVLIHIAYHKMTNVTNHATNLDAKTGMKTIIISIVVSHNEDHMILNKLIWPFHDLELFNLPSNL